MSGLLIQFLRKGKWGFQKWNKPARTRLKLKSAYWPFYLQNDFHVLSISQHLLFRQHNWNIIICWSETSNFWVNPISKSREKGISSCQNNVLKKMRLHFFKRGGKKRRRKKGIRKSVYLSFWKDEYEGLSKSHQL